MTDTSTLTDHLMPTYARYPVRFARGEGARLWDADGNEYLDYHAAFAPHLLGHNDPAVNGAVREAMDPDA